MTKLFTRSSVVQASLDNTKGLNKEITQSQTTHIHIYTDTHIHKHTMILFLWYLDSFTTGSPDHSAVWFLSSLKHLFPEGDDISWGTLSHKSFFFPLSFPLLMEVCKSVILQLQKNLQGGSGDQPNQNMWPGENTRTSLGLKIPEGQRVTALGKG